MLIGAKIGGKVYSKKAAENLLYTVKENLEKSCSKLYFSNYFTAVKSNLVFSRSEWKGESGSLSCEYRKSIRVDVEITSSKATKGEVVFDVEENLFAEVLLKDFNGIFYFKPHKDYLDSIKDVFGCSFFDACRLINYPKKFKISLQVFYELFVNFDAVEIDEKSFSYGSRYGGVSVQLDRTFRYSENIEDEIKIFLENLIFGESTGAFGGLDAEVIQMKQMMERAEKELLINSGRLLFYSPISKYDFLSKKESFIAKFKNGTSKLSDTPLEIALNVKSGGEGI